MATVKRSALISGASRGIGKAIATALGAEGYDLYLICRQSADSLYSLSEKLSEQYHINCECFIGDVSDEDFCDSVFSKIESLDVLINNAGISYVGLLQDMTSLQWHNVIDTNLTSAFYLSSRAIPMMVSKKAGSIVNISSMWGRVGASMEVAYSASKGGLNAMTQALAKELAPSNISVNAIACGVIDTDMNSHLSMEEKEALRAEIPADRFATPKEVAKAVISIINSGSYLTGQIIGFDGGYI